MDFLALWAALSFYISCYMRNEDTEVWKKKPWELQTAISAPFFSLLLVFNAVTKSCCETASDTAISPVLLLTRLCGLLCGEHFSRLCLVPGFNRLSVA